MADKKNAKPPHARTAAKEGARPKGGVVANDTASSRRLSRALQIAFGERAIVNVENTPIWEVPSQTTSRTYMVNMERRSCECEDWRGSHKECKHIVAVAIQQKKLALPDGDIRPVVPARYQNAPWYDRLQRHEEVNFKHLLRCIGATTPTGDDGGVGRDPVPMGDLLICAAWASYRNRPSRKAVGDAAVLYPLLRSENAPSPDTLRKYMLSPDLERAIRAALKLTWMCARRIDTRFAVDSTYKKTPNSAIVTTRKAGGGVQVAQKVLNCKLHAAVGTRTLMVYGADVTDENVHDSPLLVPLFQQFWDLVRIDAVYADAAYSVNPENFEAIHARGGRAFLDFHVDAKYCGSPHHDEMLRLYREDTDAWHAEYDFRPLIETVNSMIKRCIKRIVRARLEQSRRNEVLLSALVHNLVRLPHVRAAYTIDIPWADGQALDLIDKAINGDGVKDAA